MPIAEHPDYSLNHWNDVKQIIIESINETQFTPNLVSDDEAIGLIHERIVTNIYNNEIVICDVSSKNPNVMFELGLRLAFDKPVIIIKDDKTSYSFDTGVIEHINYPSSLHFIDIVNFKKKLTEKIISTNKKYSEDESLSPFLKSFGKTIIPAKIEREEISESSFIIQELSSLKDDFKKMRFEMRNVTLAKTESSQIDKKLLNNYLTDLMNKRGRASKIDFLEHTKERIKELEINISSDDLQKIVDEFWNNM